MDFCDICRGSSVFEGRCPYCNSTFRKKNYNPVRIISAVIERNINQSHQRQTNRSEIDKVINGLEAFRDRLVQFERNNRSINMTKMPDKWVFDLSVLESKIQTDIVNAAIAGKNSICIIPDNDTSSYANVIRDKFKKLHRNLLHLYYETGQDYTFLGFPFARGKVSGITIHAPLILFKVDIEHRKHSKQAGWYVAFEESKKPILNKALIYALNRYHELDINLIFDEFDYFINQYKIKKNTPKSRVLDALRTENETVKFLREFIAFMKYHNISIQYGDDEDNGRHLLSISTSHSNSNSSLFIFTKEKMLGNFPQGDTSIYADYDQMISILKSTTKIPEVIGKMINQFEATDNDSHKNSNTDKNNSADYNFPLKGSKDVFNYTKYEINDKDFLEGQFILESDPSQDAVVYASRSSKCIVVRGPPGTGKSQLIVNLISDAMSRRKKVLIICQKRAALDIVYNRLENTGLSRFVSIVHDPVKDKSKFYAHLRSRVDGNKDHFNEKLVRGELESITASIARLTDYQRSIKDALHRKNEFGLTAHKLYLLCDPKYFPRLNLDGLADNLNIQKLHILAHRFKNLEKGCKKYDIENKPWNQRADFSRLNFTDKEIIKTEIDRVLQINNESEYIFLTDSKNTLEVLKSSINIITGERSRFKIFKPKWIDARNIVKKFVPAELEIDNNYTDLKDKIERGLLAWDRIYSLSKYLKLEGFVKLEDALREKRTSYLDEKLIELREALEEFDNMRQHDVLKSTLDDSEKKILEIFINKMQKVDNWEYLVCQEVYAYWLASLEGKYPVLQSNFSNYTENARDLADLYEERRKIIALDIYTKLENDITRLMTIAPSESSSAESVLWRNLVNQVGKKKNLPSIRKLIEKYGSVLFQITPCWLATPEAVSSIFPIQKSIFDYVIFDEASQLAVERSIPSIFRGDNIVILGDERQLKPFDLFKTRQDMSESENKIQTINEDFDKNESLLIVANKVFGSSELSWHYRSQHQQLIDFSNHAFYSGRLNTIPSNIRIHKCPPILWVKCENGIWENKRNRPEAKRVVLELENILNTFSPGDLKTPTIGIITFNEGQREEILNQIEEYMQSSKSFREKFSRWESETKNQPDRKLFVKNIENVQGDERDIIIFSLGYARDRQGNIHLHFGSLNQDGGENRLNVAITRARIEIRIISSIEPYELLTDFTKFSGPKLFREYLLYSKFVSEGNNSDLRSLLKNQSPMDLQMASTLDSLHMKNTDSIESKIASKLAQLGYTVESNLGNSKFQIDLAVVHPDKPEKYILAIETDGNSFCNAATVKERDVLRKELLSSRGWKVEMVWSKHWLHESDAEIKRIVKKIERLRVS